MKYNICLVRPEGYIHSDAFLELAQVVGYALEDLGHQVSIQYQAIEKSARNIILGCHLLRPEHGKNIPSDSVIINTEQIHSDISPWSEKWTDTILSWAKNFETWDYSNKNIENFSKSGIPDVKYLKIGYHPKLTRIKKHQDQDIDVLFYGSINARRSQVINNLKREGLVVKAVSGIYGEPRDQLISRSKVVLNLHYYNTKIFEIIRVFYLMANKKAVLAEVDKDSHIDPEFLDGIYPSRYEDLVPSCCKLLDDDKFRVEVENTAFQVISRTPQSQYLQVLLD